MKAFCLLGLLIGLPLFAGEDSLTNGRQFYDLRSGEKLELPPVTPDTVIGYELLYATPGTGDIAEIAGHLLLRVKVKPAPNTVSVQGEHPYDLVISYLADTDEPAVSAQPMEAIDCRERNWLNLVLAPGSRGDEAPWSSIWQSLKGLTGGFKVIQDVQTLEYTLRHYTVAQNRTLLRYPLNLTPEQTRDLTRFISTYDTRRSPAYYFFHQNCGSVLVRELAEGIDNNTIREFTPNVSPPHSLVALMIREGVLTQHPEPFHSFRDRGYLYQQTFIEAYPDIRSKWPELEWPSANAFTWASETDRSSAVRQLQAFPLTDPELSGTLYRLGGLIQDMELAFDPRDKVCTDFTSRVTAEARILQSILLEADEGVSTYPPPFKASPAVVSRVTSLHTGLYRLNIQTIHRENHTVGSRSGARFQATVLQQEMGSPSALAMQRAGYLTLGGFTADIYEQGEQRFSMTGLELRKFQEKLGQVPSGLRSRRGWGLGLDVLHFDQDRLTGTTRSTLGGAACLISLASSPQNRNFLFVGFGLSVDSLHQRGGRTLWGLETPLQLESLVSIGDAQWRTRAEWHPDVSNIGAERVWVQSRWALPFGEWRGTETKLHLSVTWEDQPITSGWQAGIGFEINRF